MWDKFKNYCCSSLGFWTAIFVAIWLWSWHQNGSAGGKYDIVALRDMYIWLMSQLNITHAINSKWNSVDGVKP